MVLIPKKNKKELVLNPFRPKIGVPRVKTVAKLSWADFQIEYDVLEERIKLDADHNEEFLNLLESTIPEQERFRCDYREIFLIDKKWKSFLVENVKKYFDETIMELRRW